jgi:hypothetical protein
VFKLKFHSCPECAPEEFACMVGELGWDEPGMEDVHEIAAERCTTCNSGNDE